MLIMLSPTQLVPQISTRSMLPSSPRQAAFEVDLKQIRAMHS